MQNIFDDIDKNDVALLIEKGLHKSDEGELFLNKHLVSHLFLMMEGLKIQILILIVVLVSEWYQRRLLVSQIQPF